jgi:hypothetical protein
MNYDLTPQILGLMPLSYVIDDFGDVVTLFNWHAIIARMDYILSMGE